jgi:DNA polymerase-3 subunit alpha (Gram-positive type)
MMQEKTFLERFRKFQPTPPQRVVLENVYPKKVRIDEAHKKVEVEIAFSSLIDKEMLYSIEADFAAAYGLNCFFLMPKYDASLYSEAYLGQAVLELERRGIVSRGFFDHYTIACNEDQITIRLPFGRGGIQLMELGKTSQIFSDLLYSEFGLRFQVTICTDENHHTDEQEYQAQQRKILMEQIRKSKEEARQKFEEMQAQNPALIPVTMTLDRSFDPEVQFVTDDVIKVGHRSYDISSPEALLGPAFVGNPVAIRTLTQEARGVIFCGDSFSFENKPTRKGDKGIVNFFVTDNDSSIAIKALLPIDEANALEKKMKKSRPSVMIKGNLKMDQFTQELCIEPKSILKIKRIHRQDNAPEKRVELHLHTNMSTMDATITPQELVDTALRWGHKAIAITDHGTVQAFPEVMNVIDGINGGRKKEGKELLDLKILYGVEAYYVDDTARATFGDADTPFDGEFCVFDIETTGLSAFSCHITEIGAVILKNGEVVDRFQTFVDPEEPIPENITQLTGITDEMVQGAPKAKDAVSAFLEFAGDRILVAHNANFDISFIRKAADDYGIPFHSTYLDTVAMSRYVNPELKRHKLDILAEYFHLGNFNHHRASDDAEMLAMILSKMMQKLNDEGIRSIGEMQRVMSEQSDPLKLPSYHQIILVKNQVGMKNLYKLISAGYLQFYRKHPRIPRSLLTTMREGLIIGSACEAGELFRAILDNKPQSELERIASFYDYLEIQPLCNNRFLIDQDRVRDEEGLKDLNRRVVQLGEKLHIPVVATCDAHFLNKDDEIYRKILLKGMKFADGDKDVGIYLRTTEEMLEEFAYLGEEKAYEVVVTNPNKIADMVEDVRPIPKGTYTPKMEGAEKELQESCWRRAKEWYGDPLPKIVEERLAKELDSIIKHGFAVLYVIAVRLVAYSESLGYQVGSRGSVGSSFVATMSGISEVNPLKPHYRCPKCKFTQFFTDGSVGSGYDLPQKNCPQCGELLISDGHDIPFETFLGFYGDKSPDIDLNFSGDVQGKVHKYTEELFGRENVFRAGTIGTLAAKTAYGFVMKYLEEKGLHLNRAEVERLTQGCVGIRRTTGQHPGGIIVVPKEYDIYDFTPVQHPADDPNSNIITTHFQFSYLHDTILKLDELGHDMPTKYKMLERYTNTSVLDVPMGDKKVYELFQSTKPLNCDLSAINCELGTLGLPEMSTGFVRQVLMDAKPKNFADLLQISGLTHGTDVWLGNAQDLIKENVCDISQVIGTRDGIMLDLIRYGMDNGISFKIMEAVRKGKGLTPEWEAAMRESNVPQWYLDSCKKIKYMFPKAHAAAYVMSAIRLGWYKVYYPLEFYAAFFTVAPSGFDSQIVLRGKDFVLQTIKEIEAKGYDATQKETEMVTGLQLAYECYARGIQFLPVDLYESDATAFLPENGAIRVPLNSLPGLGDTAANKICETCFHKEKLFSIQELQEQTGISKAVLEILEHNGVLKGLNETNQFTFF